MSPSVELISDPDPSRVICIEADVARFLEEFADATFNHPDHLNVTFWFTIDPESGELVFWEEQEEN